MTETTDASAIRASLVLRDFGDDPNLITELLGLQPTRAGRAGDSLLGPSDQATTRTVRRTYWSLHSRLDPTASMSEHVRDILGQLGDAAQHFARLPAGTITTLRCTVIPDDDLPILSVDSQSMQRLGEVGADLEIDIVSVDGPEDKSA